MSVDTSVSVAKKGTDIVEKKMRAMMRVAAQIEQYPLAKIPQSALIEIRKDGPKNLEGVFKDLCEFVAYLQRTHRYFGDNPFLKFFEKNPRVMPRDFEKISDKLDVPESLNEDVDKNVRQEISSADPDDEKATAFLLVYGLGLSATVACKLIWGDILFGKIKGFPESCQIKLKKDNTTGATHDYLRPTFPYVARELKRRYDALKLKDLHLDGKRVVGSMTAAQLTAYCRTRLFHLGASYADVTDAKTKTIGGGIMLLQKNYHYRLKHDCAIHSSAELNYLRLKSLGKDVTADNYRSLSAPSGQERLQRALNRWVIPEAKPKSAAIAVEVKDDGRRRVTIPPDDPSRTTKATVRLKLKKGQRVDVYSRDGLNGMIIVK